MAGEDLGSIDFREPRGGGEVRSSGIGKSLADLGAMVNAKKTRDILGEFRDIEQKVVADSLAADPTEPQEGDPTLNPTGNAEVDRFQNRVTKLRAAIEQGNTSQRSLAELNLKRELSKFQARFPGLRNELAGEFGQFARTSPGLDELGLRDVRDGEFSILAAKDLARLEDYAYKSVGNGGLGISPGLSSATTAFAAKFIYKDAIQNGVQTEAMYGLVLDSNTKADGITVAQNWKASLQGLTTPIYENLHKGLELASETAELLRKGLTGVTSEQVNEWNVIHKPNLIRDTQALILQLQARWENVVSPRIADVDEIKASKAQLDGTISHFERLLTAIGDDGSPDLLKAWELERSMRTAALRDRSKPLDRSLDLVEAFRGAGPLIEIIGPRDIIIKSGAGEVVGAGLEDLTKILYEDGPQEAEPDRPDGVMSAEETAKQSRRNRSINPNENNCPDTGDGPQMECTVDALFKQNQLLGAVNAFESPSSKATVVNGLASQFDRIWELGIVHDEQMEQVQGTLLDPNWEEIARNPTNDLQLQQSVKNAGEQAFKVWDSYQGGEQSRQENFMRPLVQTRIEGGHNFGDFPANAVLEVDVTDINNGSVKVVINPEKLDKVLNEQSGNARGPTFTGALGIGARRDPKVDRRRIREQLDAIALEYGAMLTTNMATNAQIQFARRIEQREPNADVDYIRAYFNNDYELILPTPGTQIALKK